MGCATGLVKIIVFVFNFLFVLAGLALIILGALFKTATLSEAFPGDEAKNIEYPAIFIITVGSIIFVIAFLGCCGVVKRSTCMLTSYAVILIILLVLQIAIGVYAFILTKDAPELKNEILKSLREGFKSYEKSEAVKSFYNELQSTNKCCGVDGPADYGIFSSMPVSCCGSQDPCIIINAYKVGCGTVIVDGLKEASKTIGIVVLSIGAIELIGSILVLCLVSSIRNENRRGGYA